MLKSELTQKAIQEYFVEPKDIDELLTYFLNISRQELFVLEEIPEEKLEEIFAWLERVKRTEPIAYITGRAEFFGREFIVDKRVLVPRIDTEVLVEKVLEYSKNLGQKATLCDVGTGSWCIGQSIFLSQDPKNIEKLVAFDISAEAIEVAKINAQKHEISDSVTFVPEGFENFETYFQRDIYAPEVSNYIITANLPYIRTVDLWWMESSVFFHEPSVALFGGKQTGFELYRRFISLLKQVKQAYPHINLVLFMEFGYDQYDESVEFLTDMAVIFEHFKDTKDIWRVIKVEF